MKVAQDKRDAQKAEWKAQSQKNIESGKEQKTDNGCCGCCP